ncbi:MAG: SoxR reducing system RseC family protein [Candidatus Eisenbacteria sp.]|nr:SoxR reducing system RseC family protein [Candidatus Eisenbacteria bacterium]
MTEIGRVVSVNDDAAVIAMSMSGACKKCGLCMASGDGKDILLLTRNEVDAAPGDIVEIEISPGRVLVAAFALYLLPVLMTILGFVVGSAVSGGSEESALPIVLAITFLVVSFLAVWLFDLKVRKAERRHATVKRVLSEEEADASPRIQIVKFGG